MTSLEHKRKARRKITAEDFTPEPLVCEMLDKLPPELFLDPSKTFIDPAAGNGNFLVEVLRRKLANNHHPLIALETTYGVELMQDNVDEMKERLLELLPLLSEADLAKAKEIINHNIVCSDAFKWDFDKWKSTARKKPKPLF